MCIMYRFTPPHMMASSVCWAKERKRMKLLTEHVEGRRGAGEAKVIERIEGCSESVRGAVRRGLHVASRRRSGRVWMRQDVDPYLLLNHLQRVRCRPREDGSRRDRWRVVFGGQGPTS